MMKKKMVCFLMVLMAIVQSSFADDYSYLTFQNADGTVKSVSVSSLTLTFANGTLTAVNSNGTYAFTLTDLSKMYFTSDPTSIPGVIPSKEEAVEVYTLTGISLGKYSSLSEAQEQLEGGVYVVKSGDETFKMMKK